MIDILKCYQSLEKAPYQWIFFTKRIALTNEDGIFLTDCSGLFNYIENKFVFTLSGYPEGCIFFGDTISNSSGWVHEFASTYAQKVYLDTLKNITSMMGEISDLDSKPVTGPIPKPSP